jgi:hypothetical protein
LNTPDYLLAVPPKRGTTNRSLVWILKNTGAPCLLDFAHRSCT